MFTTLTSQLYGDGFTYAHPKVAWDRLHALTPETPLYHFTFKLYLPSIAKSGLLVRPPQKHWDWSEPGIYFSTSDSNGRDFVKSADYIPIDRRIVLMMVRKKDLDVTQLSLDPHIQFHSTDNDLFLKYNRNIPPHVIQILPEENDFVEFASLTSYTECARIHA